MPLKPKRPKPFQSSRYRPLTFSPFSRSMAIATSNKKVRREIQEAKLQTQDLPSSSGNGFLNQGKAKTELSDTSDSEDEGVVQADFVFFDPKSSDFHGVKVLLKMYLDTKEWDLNGLVDLILEQPTVGTLVKIENDEDDGVYSVVSALNLGRYKGSKCVIELKDYLLKVCHDKDVIAKLKALVGEHADEVSLLVSQRVVNLPPQLLPHLYDGLFDEVEWATEDEPTQVLRDSFRFNFYLIITKMYKHKNADNIRGSRKVGDDAIIFIKSEDEIFLELSTWSFSFPLHGQQVTTNELKDYKLTGLVMAVEASKVGLFRQQLHSLLDEN